MLDNNTIYKCEICGKEFNTIRGLCTHINMMHNDDITTKEYYDKYLKKENEGICIDCGLPTKFVKFTKGYDKYCKKCNNKYRSQKIGLSHLNKTDDEKRIIYQKKKQTCLKHFGVENSFQSDICKEKGYQTKFERYGDSCYNNRQQANNTCINKYGVDYYSQTTEYKKKIQQTKLERYGNVNYNNRQQAKDTCINKYGVENVSQSDEIKEKKKQTSNARYGVDYHQQSMQYKIELPDIQQKIYNTKKKNGTFNTSTIEEQFANYLTENNYQFERQYRNNLYPFNCDFYLPKFDLYIEINGSWTHGKHPYNSTDENDIATINKWKLKNTEFYDNAIETWTVRDVTKLKIAKKNNLNYLPIYSNNIDDVIILFNNYIKNNILYTL